MRSLAAWLALCSASAWAADLSLGVGFNYSEGDYGTATTTSILSVPVTARYETARWIFKVTVPYVEVSGDTAVVPGIGRVDRPRTDGTEAGLGDIVASATYGLYYDKASKLGVDVTGKVKFGTADEGLGTGEEDVSLLVEPFKTFDRVTVFGSLGYHVLGASALVAVNDVWSASLGASYRVDDRDSVGVAYDWRERVSARSGAVSELTAFWARKLDRQWKAQVYVLKGFSTGSPDWGIGASVAYAF